MLRHKASDSSIEIAHLLHKARAIHVEGELARAEKLYKVILEREPDNFDAAHLLGVLNYQRDRPTEALRYLAAAVKRNMRSAEALSNYGLALHSLGQIEDALASYVAALGIEPDNVDLLNKCGIALLELARPKEALQRFDRALTLNPAHVEALGNRGNTLLKLNHLDEAIASYDAVRAIGCDSAALLTNRAHVLRRLGRLEEALADLQLAVSLDSNFAEAQFELGMVQLTLGNFEDGWVSYEQRWSTRRFLPYLRVFKSPLWTGEQSLNGLTILLHAEQGFGDTIQFVRYAPSVTCLGATVVLEVQPELVSLMTAAGIATRVIARGERLVPFDLHCPLMSLPRVFRTTIATIPAQVPYLKVPRNRIAKWAKHLPSGRPLVGIAWAGGRSHNNDINRSIALARFAPILSLAEVQFVSLQQCASADDRMFLVNHRNVFSVGDNLLDFSDTAAVISQLDCVISVDTAVAHLAGSLATKTLLLLPFAADFRWQSFDDDSKWYPTAKLFRQPRSGDWESVIEKIRAHLVFQ